MPIPAFLDGIHLNLAYWGRQASGLEIKVFKRLDADRKNLHRAIHAGLEFSDTSASAAELALSLFDFIEWGGYWREWIPVLEMALANTHTAETRIRLLNQLGFLHMLNRDNAQGMRRHAEAEAVALEAENRFGVANARFGISQVHYHAHQYAMAEQYGQKALTLFLQMPEQKRKLASVFNHLGMICHAQGAYPQAERYLTQAITTARETGAPGLLANLLANLAITLQMCEKHSQALDCLQEALVILEHPANPLQRINVLNALGTCYFSQAQYIEAEKTFLAMDASFLRQNGHVAGLGYRANNLGNVYLQTGRLNEAEIFLREAADYFELTKDEVSLANTLGDLAETLTKQKRLEEARPLLDKALHLLERYPQNAWARDCYARLAKSREELNHRGRSN